MKRIIILGAGISGLTAAIKLKELDDNFEITILEKNNRLGGLITSTEKGNYWFDSGCYLFDKNHSLYKKYPNLFTDINSYKCSVWIKNRFFSFPFQIRELMNSVSIIIRLKFVFSVLIGNLTLKYSKNANTWLSSRVGKAVMNYTSLDDYIEKLQTLDSRKISPYLCKSRLQPLDKSVFSILKNLLKKSINNKSYSPLQYPKGGVIKIINALSSECQQKNIQIELNSDINNVVKHDNKFTIFSNMKSFESEYLISTIPLNSFLNIFHGLKMNKLSIEYTNSYISMFLVKNISFDNSYLNIYSFESKYKWKKLTAIKMEDGKYSIIIETTFSIYKEISPNRLNNEIKNNLISDLRLFKDSDLISEDYRRIDFTYPIFSLETISNIKTIINQLEKEHNLILIGRQASFKYYSANLSVKLAEKAVCEHFATS